jgi:hypothetical protein
VLDFPIVIPSCSCIPFVPDAVNLSQSYCITLENDFYTIFVSNPTGQPPFMIIHEGCGTYPCQSPGCTPGDLSQVEVAVFWDHIELTNNGPCGCFCLTFDHYLPAEVVAFDARVSGAEILVHWTTASETNHDHFVLERSYESGGWERIGIIRAQGTATSGSDYVFHDIPLVEGRYTYRLSSVSISGVVQVLPQNASAVYTRSTDVPEAFSLDQNYPNPFNPETTIRYTLGDASHTTLKIYSIDGRDVATLVDREQPAGQYAVQFKAAQLPSGMYLYRLEAQGQVATRKLMLLK